MNLIVDSFCIYYNYYILNDLYLNESNDEWLMFDNSHLDIIDRG